MNEKDIYELIGNSFDDKIKLDFDDVKKRIEKLEDSKITVITPSAPSGRNVRKVFTFIGAAAACLIFVFGLSVFFLQSAGVKEEASYAAYNTETACEESEIFYAPSESESFDYYTEDDADLVLSETVEEPELAKDTLSDSDMSDSDITSDSDA